MATIAAKKYNKCFQALDTKTTNCTLQINVLVLHLTFHHLTVVKVSFCNLMKGITPKICMLCFVLINSVLFNLLYVSIISVTIIMLMLNKN